jgi:hypothetical protein
MDSGNDHEIRDKPDDFIVCLHQTTARCVYEFYLAAVQNLSWTEQRVFAHCNSQEQMDS